MKMEDMDKAVHGAKKSSLMALHKLMKDLHHKALASKPEEDQPHSAVVELDVEHSPLSDSEHDEENKGHGVNPFDASDMEGDEASELADAHESDDEDQKDLHLPDGLHQMLKDHLKKKY